MGGRLVSKIIKGNLIAPTSTAMLLRAMFFQPTQKPVAVADVIIKTSHGQIKVTGCVGQRHADLLDAILYHAEAARELPGGGIDLLVDPARIRSTMWTGGRRGNGSRRDRRYSAARIEKLLDGLQDAKIEIQDSRCDVMAKGALIADRVPSAATRIDPRTGEHRHLWTVRLGIVVTALLARDIKVYYDPSPIARLDYGVTQALARHVFGHQREPKGGWYLDTLIAAVCGPDVTSQALRNARRRVRAESEALNAMGIIIDGDRVRVPGGVVRRPGAVPQRPGASGQGWALPGSGVPQQPGAVPQRPGAVPQRPGACRSGPGVADISDISDTPGDLAVPG